ncbi:TetR/AcrR family transcriptional regulator [Paenibacillus sp. F6_3S_P_1C]|uniref:TetR/AcrR family transcriptional regulator n=1 Tax=Paenibacillus vandeheii TaxID=3035917 RepID=A0ABT8JHL7_9BACL|nr:TetR/AcrR family transcriptional regulator [Paenibacillus vandeheii]MDN4604658.1 TetR/AcrR family transcriptional regulator [Paenibacillus vandeheii]
MKVILIRNEDKPSPSKGRGLKTYQEARLQNTENLRKLVVDAAAAILQEEGPEAVTVRRVSQKMGCSTKIIYNLFVNKEGLAQQLYLEGCKLLARRFEEVPLSSDLLQHLLDLGEAFWQFGQDYTSYYKLMFGGAFAEFKPDAESMQGTMTAISRLQILISNAQQQGQISDQEETGTLVSTIWASLHGVIHLYMGGFLADVNAAHTVYKQTMDLMSQSLFAVSKPD